jgi:hypothetical protein
MMDPFSIAAMASLGISGATSLFGPDPDEMSREATEENRRLIEERWRQMQRLYGRRGEFFREQMDILNPKLAFAGTQGRMAADVGARASQATLRRQLGEGGDIFAAMLESGGRTAAVSQQNTLRALAHSEALTAADREIAGRVSGLQAQPIAFAQPATGAKAAQTAGLFAQIGTGLGYLGAMRNQNQNNTVSDVRHPMANRDMAPAPYGWDPYSPANFRFGG